MAGTAHMFFSGEYPNGAAQPAIDATARQIEASLCKLGWQSRRVERLLSRPHDALERLRPIGDPLIGI